MKVLLTLHLVAAVFLVGPLIASGMTGLRALRTGDAAAARLTSRMTTLYSWLSLLVAIFGLAMVQGRNRGFHISFSETWIQVSIALYVVALVLSLLLVAPTLSAAARGLDAGEAIGSLRARAGASAGVVALLYLAILVLMVYRP